MGKEARLEPSERTYLNQARKATTALRGLEAYSRLWDLLDIRLGDGNEVTRVYANEFMSRWDGVQLQEPTNPYDVERFELMKASFLYKRLYPPEVAMALAASTLFKSARKK